VAGDEGDILRKIRIGQFQGAGLTVAGLAEIDPAFKVFHLPMLFGSDAELEATMAALGAEFDRRLEAKGFVRLMWARGGWVHLFSRQEIRVVDDLKRQKLFVWAGDDALVQQWRKNGFQPVPLAATDILMGLQTQLIDAVPATPGVALTLQWFRQTPHMLGLGIGPLPGAVVITKAAWEKLAAADRQALLAAAAEAGKKLAAEVPKYEADSIAEMKKRGLAVVEVSAVEREAWRQAAEDFARGAREGQVPPEILDAARKAIAAARTGGGGAP
jgi:TRAP-type C4-dicarboxylate transport system substrate-binding protein